MDLKQDELGPMFDRITDAFVSLDAQWRYRFVNAKAAQIFGRRPEDLIGRNIWEEFPEGLDQPFHRVYEQAMAEQRFIAIESYYPPYERWFENRIYPSPDGLTIYFQDITARRRSQRMEAGHQSILKLVAAQRPLPEILERIALLHQSLNPGALCSVLLLDGSGTHVVHGAAPNLDPSFNDAIDGLPIAYDHGSCGAAAWNRERVIAGDIATHPMWDSLRDLALAHGLRACWSTPILGSKGAVLGTFAVYYRECREPSHEELEDIDRIVPIASIAIESARLLERMHERDCFFDLSMEINCIFDPNTQRIVQANPMFTVITGFSEQELCSRDYQEFVHPLDRGDASDEVARLTQAGGKVNHFTYRFLCKDGTYRWLEWESVTVPHGFAYAVGRDVTERRVAEEKLAYAASHDAVTGLAQYLQFDTTLATRLLEGHDPVSVLFIGVDRFQLVNDAIGNVAGDAVLKCIADRLQAVLGDSGEIARFAGDQFVIAASGPGRNDVMALANRLRAAVARPIEGDTYRLLLTASIGISHYPESGDNPKDLLRRAETAMRMVKREGRDDIREFSVAQMLHLEDYRTLGGHLREAIASGEFALHYQPRRSASGHALIGFEALLRWNNVVLGDVPPARFIPIAEALGLMPDIGAWVLGEACRQARAWLDDGFRDFTIAINVSAEQLQRPGLVEQVDAATSLHGIAPSMLDVELTESALIENVARTQRTLTGLKQLGTHLSLDDFGTGYSSLAYLKQFPIDKLKIDQSFVRGLPSDADDAAIAKTIIAMAHQLRMTVSAEGVETQEQSLFLTDIGCDELQGYHLGRPVAAAEAERHFQTQRVP
jgi:diguanylate cyclase (GGDEF)-like protein/PAS domain S-box-containing protein